MITPAQDRLIQATLAPAALASQISTDIAAKVLDSSRQQGAAVLQLLQNAALPISPDPSLGAHLDTTA